MSVFSNLLNGARLGLGKASLALRAHSPEIMIVGGVAAVVAGVVVACKSTVKAIEVHKQYKEDMAKVEESIANVNGDIDYDPNELVTINDYLPITVTQAQKDKFILNVQYGWKYVKTYLLSFLLVAGGLTCLVGSSMIFKNRWLGMSAAYTALKKANDEYRKRVGEEVGEEKEGLLWQNVKALEVTKDDENGIPVTETKLVPAGPKFGSPYSVLFDEHAPAWTRSPSANKAFVIGVQNYANDILNARGYVYLDEVYKWLELRYEPRNGRYDITPKQAMMSHHVGWLAKGYGNGDGFIDFGLKNRFSQNFMDGEDASVLLDFNVDGDIEYPMYKVK